MTPLTATGLALILAVWPTAVPAGEKPQAAAQADTVLLGGKIVSLDARDSIHEALAIRDGQIVAVGSNAEITGYIGEKTAVIRLKGKTVVPGLIEAHVHALGAAQASIGAAYTELASIAAVQEWIRRQAERTPPRTWVVVPRNEITRLAERRHPTPAELDAACTTHPVAFNSARRWALNSLGFRTAGIDERAQEVPGGRIVRDAAGSPRLIAGGDAFLRRFFPWPKYDDRQTLDALENLLRRYNEVGITSINERAANRDTYRLYRALGDRGCRRIRVTLTFRQQMHKADDVTRFVQQLGFRPGEGDDWIKIGPLKITVDGGIHWGTASLSEPYGRKRAEFYVLEDPGYRGEQYYRVEEMQEVFAAAHRLGWQMCCHVTGDAGVTSVLDALEAAHRQVPLADRRFTLLHSYFPTPEIAERCKRLGVCVDTHPYLYHKDSDTIAEVYGRSWAERFIGLGDWVRGGVPVALTSDHMEGLDPNHAMNSFNPFLQVYLAVSRLSAQGRVYGPRQKVSRIAALRMVTATAAYLDFNEAKIGSLEPGKLADLAVLDRDVLTCPEPEIRRVKVLLTMVGGKVVFERK